MIVGKQGANFKEVIRQVGELDGNVNNIILRAKEDPQDPTIRWIHCAAMHDKIVPLLMSLANLMKGAYTERDIGLTNYRNNANNGIKGNGSEFTMVFNQFFCKVSLTTLLCEKLKLCFRFSQFLFFVRFVV